MLYLGSFRDELFSKTHAASERRGHAEASGACNWNKIDTRQCSFQAQSCWEAHKAICRQLCLNSGLCLDSGDPFEEEVSSSKEPSLNARLIF